MINLQNRSYEKELLDQADLPFEDIRLNMQELNFINTYLGGHGITCKGINNLLKGITSKININICEIGCGGGDNLQAIYQYCLKHKINVRFTGIDMQPACIAFAKQQYPDLPVSWIISDYKEVDFGDEKPDIIFSSLFCHHFTNTELISMLKWMRKYSRLGFFINDLQRHVLAYYSIKYLTRLFSKSYLVKNDAPLSVARGFTKKEWKEILNEAEIETYSLSWQWAFRYLLIYIHARK